MGHALSGTTSAPLDEVPLNVASVEHVDELAAAIAVGHEKVGR